MRFRGACFRTRNDGSFDGQLFYPQEHDPCSNYGLVQEDFSGRQLSICIAPTPRKEPHAKTANLRYLGPRSCMRIRNAKRHRVTRWYLKSMTCYRSIIPGDLMMSNVYRSSRTPRGAQRSTDEVSKMLQVRVESTVHESTQTRPSLIPRWSS